jgi:hypothetical protein
MIELRMAGLRWKVQLSGHSAHCHFFPWLKDKETNFQLGVCKWVNARNTTSFSRLHWLVVAYKRLVVLDKTGVFLVVFLR